MNEITLILKEKELNQIFEKLTEIINVFLKNNIYPCILLSGELGSGKTTLVREWLRFVGSKDLANSPTFALHNIYEWEHYQIHHFDLYRIKESFEIDQLGFDEIWGIEGVSFIEWWKIADSYIPLQGRLIISIEHLDFENRKYILTHKTL